MKIAKFFLTKRGHTFNACRNKAQYECEFLISLQKLHIYRLELKIYAI